MTTPPEDTEAGVDRILTVPNAITAVRLACVPVFVWLLFGAHRQIDGRRLLAVLGATDWVDGYVARRWHQVSTVGKVLDPTADRVLVATAVISVIVAGAVPLWFGLPPSPGRCWSPPRCCCWPLWGRSGSTSCGWARPGRSASCSPIPRSSWPTAHAGWQQPIEVIAWLAAVPALILSWIAAACVHPAGSPRAAPGGRREPAIGGGVGSPRVLAMKAVIMAGGEGTRLRPLTSNQPKPMLPMANRPMMEHVINLLRQHGFEDIVVTVAFMANAIRSYFGDGSEFGVRMVYATEETPLGTAGSVLNARDELDERFVVISGDVLTDIDLTSLVDYHESRGRWPPSP